MSESFKQNQTSSFSTARFDENDLVGGRVDHIHLRRKAGRHKRILAVRAKENHARTVCSLYPPDLLLLRWVNHADVVLASNSHPEFAAVGSEECLVWRPAHIDLPLYGVRLCVD